VGNRWWSILFAVVNLAALGLFVVAPFSGWWLPKDVSVPGFGSEVDLLFYGILAVTGFFFILTEALLVYAMWTYGSGAGARAWYVHGNHKLEWAWTLVPAVILLLVAFSQIHSWEKIKYLSQFPPPDQLIEVSARQFEWRIRYPTAEANDRLTAKPAGGDWKTDRPVQAAVAAWEKDGYIDDVHVVNELHTWKGAKVRVFLKTRDVIHSLFLPNLRLKQDALPGKTIPVWLETREHNVEWDESKSDWRGLSGPDGREIENWGLACAELCGWGHYKMQGRFFVHKDKADFERWLKQMQDKQNAHELTKP
jgi:cytochrome c oxidase subunit 2